MYVCLMIHIVIYDDTDLVYLDPNNHKKHFPSINLTIYKSSYKFVKNELHIQRRVDTTYAYLNLKSGFKKLNNPTDYMHGTDIPVQHAK